VQHRRRTPRVPVVTIVVINDGITIDFHLIEIAINIAVVSIATIVIRLWHDNVVAQHLQLPIQHPAEYDGVRMVMERHAHVGGEDEYPRRVPPWRETQFCPSLRHQVCRIRTSNHRNGRGAGGCNYRLTALSDAKRSSVQPQHYFTYRELQ
jgi:hypothetical protein